MYIKRLKILHNIEFLLVSGTGLHQGIHSLQLCNTKIVVLVLYVYLLLPVIAIFPILCVFLAAANVDL